MLQCFDLVFYFIFISWFASFFVHPISEENLSFRTCASLRMTHRETHSHFQTPFDGSRNLYFLVSRGVGFYASGIRIILSSELMSDAKQMFSGR